MKEIRLIKLILRDFQGGTFTLDADGEDVSAYGDNGTGKTRLASAWSWLWFGKDSLGRSDFDIKNLNESGEAAHGLDHVVEGVFDEDGNQITLKKIYREKWTKKRGQLQAEFSGHTTDYFIDGVPSQEKEYVAKVAEIAGTEKNFRLLTSPSVFPTLPWKEQRTMVITMAGISENELKKKEDRKKILEAKKRTIKEEIEKIPIRITENKRMMPDIGTLHVDEIDKEIIAVENILSDAKLKLKGIDTGGGIAELSRILAGINADLQKMENEHSAEAMKQVNKLNQQISELEGTLRNDRRREKEIEADSSRRLKAIDTMQLELEALRQRWIDVDSEEFRGAIADTCAACGQSLPASRVAEARERALADFNNSKAERLSKVERNGQELAAEKNRIEREVNNLVAETEVIKLRTLETEDRLTSMTLERDLLKQRAESYTDIPGHVDLVLKKAEYNAAIETEKKGHSQDTDKIKEEIVIYQTRLAEAKEKADRFITIEKIQKRIKELMADEKRLSAEYEAIEKEFYSAEQELRETIEAITEKVNGMFEIVKFKMFDVQINGAINDCCEITVGGVGYNSGLNNAARINAGLDIIRTLQKYYGLIAPVVIDNRESVTKIVAMPCQVISLIVSEPDKALRVETTKQLTHGRN
jgi:hypothetical protein